MFFAAAPLQAEPPLVMPVDGQPFRAILVAADAQWRLGFRDGHQTRTMHAADLVRWGTCPEPQRGPIILLADGGLLAANDLRADRESLAAESDLFGTVRVPRERLAGVVLATPADRHRCDLLLDRIHSATGPSDRVLLANGDELSGRVVGIGEGKIHMETDAGPLAIDLSRVTALSLDPSLRKPPEVRGLRAWTGLSDGSQVLATQLLTEDGTLRVGLAGGLQWKTSTDKLVFLQPLGGRAVYLSDCKVAGYRQIPYLQLPWPYRLDRNVAGDQLRAGGQLYLKGLGVHSAARITYQLDKPYERFQAELAVDDATDGRGSVAFHVYVDGQEKYTSPVIRGGQPPLPISVDLVDAKRLDLLIDYADRADVLDYADWLDARVVKLSLAQAFTPGTEAPRQSLWAPLGVGIAEGAKAKNKRRFPRPRRQRLG